MTPVIMTDLLETTATRSARRAALLGAGALALVACGASEETGEAQAAAAAPQEASDAQAVVAQAAPAEEAAEVAKEAAGEEPVDLALAPTGLYKAEQGHRYITFTYSHQGFSAPYLRWRQWDADLNWNAEDPTQSTIEVTIDATSVDSGVDAFDEHLKSEDFFDVEKHPTITFKSSALERTGPNTGVMQGELTVKGEAKPVSVDVKINKADYDQRYEGHKIGFSGRAKVLRSDLGVGLYVPFVGDEVEVIIEAEFVEAKGESGE